MSWLIGSSEVTLWPWPTLWHNNIVLCVTNCVFSTLLWSTQPLPPMVSASPSPQSGTCSHLAFVFVHHHIRSIIVLKGSVSSKLILPPAAHTNVSNSAFVWHCIHTYLQASSRHRQASSGENCANAALVDSLMFACNQLHRFSKSD